MSGLTLREHPVSFLRPGPGPGAVHDLRRRQRRARTSRLLKAAGLVLVRQRPGSAKGVMFITMEDETGVANLVVWEQVYEKHRRTVLTASMLGVAAASSARAMSSMWSPTS